MSFANKRSISAPQSSFSIWASAYEISVQSPTTTRSGGGSWLISLRLIWCFRWVERLGARREKEKKSVNIEVLKVPVLLHIQIERVLGCLSRCSRVLVNSPHLIPLDKLTLNCYIISAMRLNIMKTTSISWFLWCFNCRDFFQWLFYGSILPLRHGLSVQIQRRCLFLWEIVYKVT